MTAMLLDPLVRREPTLCNRIVTEVGAAVDRHAAQGGLRSAEWPQQPSWWLESPAPLGPWQAAG
jgi:hypothetical protein